MKIYVDNAATTKMSPAAIQAMLTCFDRIYGNPSSLHSIGQQAADAVYEARTQIAACLGCHPKEIIFTSGGSEADNQAILTAARIGARKGKKHILSTPIEHHAVLHTLQRLQKEGFSIEYLPVNSFGEITPKQVADAIRPDTALVTVMYANNEIGTILPVPEIGRLCARRQVLFHTDAVQAVGHLPIHVKQQEIQMLSLSAHKFHGPKGIGVLYAQKGIPVASLIEGGGQEGGRRAGTENVPAILGMAAALKESCLHMEENSSKVSSLRSRLLDGLLQIPHSALNGSPDCRLPGNINICFEGIEGERLLLALDQQGICASAGSACTASSADPSHVLRAIGLPHELARGSLRISLCADNTIEEIEKVIGAVTQAVASLRDHSPLWKEKCEGLKPFLLK
ncbi:MAG: cysteine desulfurase family protein [Eubacteriales bacterium]|nr:cysteine desulfurase family protein [Eubacteriales bacterium]